MLNMFLRFGHRPRFLDVAAGEPKELGIGSDGAGDLGAGIDRDGVYWEN